MSFTGVSESTLTYFDFLSEPNETLPYASERIISYVLNRSGQENFLVSQNKSLASLSLVCQLYDMRKMYIACPRILPRLGY